MAVPVSHNVYNLIKILNKRTTPVNYVTKPKVKISLGGKKFMDIATMYLALF